MKKLQYSASLKHAFSIFKRCGKFIGKIATNLNSLGASSASHAIVSRAVLPASYLKTPKLALTSEFEIEVESMNEQILEFTKITESGIAVEVLQIMPQAKVEGYVIALVGNCDFYQNHLDELYQLAQSTKLGIMSFNYPKKISSAAAVIATFAELINPYLAEVGAKNIVLKGHSIGGAFASYIAQGLHKKGHSIGLITDRSFTRLDLAAHELMGITQKDASFLLKTYGWELNPEDVIGDIDPTCQHHFFIEDDAVVKAQASTRNYTSVPTEEIFPYVISADGFLRHLLEITDLKTKDKTPFLDRLNQVIKGFRRAPETAQ